MQVIGQTGAIEECAIREGRGSLVCVTSLSLCSAGLIDPGEQIGVAVDNNFY